MTVILVKVSIKNDDERDIDDKNHSDNSKTCELKNLL